MYYTFEGTVSSIYGPHPEIFTDNGIVAGSDFGVTFEVDFDEDGYRIYLNGTIRVFQDGDWGWPDFFYTAYIGGSALDPLPDADPQELANCAQNYWGCLDSGGIGELNGNPTAAGVLVFGSGHVRD